MHQSPWLSSRWKAAFVVAVLSVGLSPLSGVSGQMASERPVQGSNPIGGPYGSGQIPTNEIGISGIGTSTIDLSVPGFPNVDSHIDQAGSSADRERTDREEAAAKAREAEIMRVETARAANELRAFARQSRPNSLAIIQKIRRVATP